MEIKTITQSIPKIPSENKSEYKSFKEIVENYKENQILKLIGQISKNFIKRRLQNADFSKIKMIQMNTDDSYGDEIVKILAETISKNHNIEAISIYDDKITEVGLKILTNSMKMNKNIVVFNIGGNWINNKCAKVLSRMIKNNAKLIYVSIDFSNIMKEGIIKIRNAVLSNPHIRGFYFGSYHMSDLSAESIIKNMFYLTAFKIGFGYHTNDILKPIADLMKQHLYSLFLECPYIDDSGFIKLTEVIKKCNNLNTFHIKNFEIKDNESVLAISQAIQINSHISSFGIENSNLTDLSIPAFVDLIKNCHHLKTIFIFLDKITDFGAIQLAEALHFNKNLTSFYLWSWNLTVITFSEFVNNFAKHGFNNLAYFNIGLQNFDKTMLKKALKKMSKLENSHFLNIRIGNNKQYSECLECANKYKSQFKSIKIIKSDLFRFYKEFQYGLSPTI